MNDMSICARMEGPEIVNCCTASYVMAVLHQRPSRTPRLRACRLNHLKIRCANFACHSLFSKMHCAFARHLGTLPLSTRNLGKQYKSERLDANVFWYQH